jgi:signal peptidase
MGALPDTKDVTMTLKHVRTAALTVALIVLFSLALLAASSALPFKSTPRLFAVMSGSMEPALRVGSAVVVVPRQQYKLGQVVTYRDLRNPKATTTHRIVEVNENGFVTKGDANDAPDTNAIRPPAVVGQVALSIPKLGYLVSFARTPIGLTLLIILPAMVIISIEVSLIAGEIKRLRDVHEPSIVGGVG